MRSFGFPGGLRSVVCLGAHPDDIEIGAGGTIAAIADAEPEATFTFVVFSGTPERAVEAVGSAEGLLGNRVVVHVGDFEDSYIPYRDPAGAKDFLRSVAPADADLVIAPSAHDAHQDHRFVAQLAGEVLRNHATLGYEIAKYDGDLGQPSVYVPLGEREANAKVGHLHTHFASQRDKPWFDRESFLGLMRLRGIEAKAPDGYAEAFYASKIVMAVKGTEGRA